MKIHRITYCLDGQERQQFAASDSEASKRTSILKATKGIEGKPERAPIDIPTDKTGLIEWLNKNASHTVLK